MELMADWCRDDRLVKVAPMLAMVNDWRGLLDSAMREEQLRDSRDHGRTGRPLGNATFVERIVCRTLGETRWSRPKPTKARPKASIPHAARLDIVSPELKRSRFERYR